MSHVWVLARGGFAALSIIALGAPSSATPLMEVDLFAPGDALITRDLDAGLDWLDLPVTTNLSMNDIWNGAEGWVDDGWRYATGVEICGVFLRLGYASEPCLLLDPINDSPSYTSQHLVMNHLSLLGYIQKVDFGHQTIGIFDAESDEWPGGIAVYGHGELGSSAFAYPHGIGEFDASPVIGNFLVRPIPEPSTALLVAFGLATFAGTRRRARLPGRTNGGR